MAELVAGDRIANRKIDMSDFPPNKRIVKLGEEEIVLDSSRLEFNGATINEFMERLGVWYDYFVQKTAEAEAMLAGADLNYDLVYGKSYEYFKEEQGCTDRLSDAKAKSNIDVINAKKSCIAAKLKHTQLKLHVKAWDKAHDQAQSRGHMIRKEMDKLNSEVYLRAKQIDEHVDEIVKGI